MNAFIVVYITTEALPEGEKPELSPKIYNYAQGILKGPKGDIWKQRISLPRDLRVEFPNSLEDDERNVEGNENVDAHVEFEIGRLFLKKQIFHYYYYYYYNYSSCTCVN